MKKLIVLLLSSLLVLGACGEKKEESILDPAPKDEKKEKKETKKENKDSKDKETNKESEPKTEEESTKENITNEQQVTEEVNTSEQPLQEQQSVEQPVEQEQVSQNQNNQANELNDFCANAYPEIPEPCRTPAIEEAGKQKYEMEMKAMEDRDNGVISEEESMRRQEEATQILIDAQRSEFGQPTN
ncbi:hypothetical protein CD117_02895 [Mammaliicoccus sciuri]|uniref:Lipoprotein n=1 Tax=Mammaliicoccus sciuri TaxID=1296 RepID=A0AAJ4VIR9_MAMSC|nr:hypothetical protein [Mammaliicoccus sciuri]RTX74370.1 hypothetical protein CD117_02895 [Mammaliicoccus sciuri]